MSFKELLGAFLHSMSKNAPSIMTGFGIGFMVTGTVLAAKNTPAALEEIRLKKDEEGVDRLDMVQVVQATWRCYLSSLISCGAGIVLIIAALVEGNRRQAALAAVAANGTAYLKEFQDYRKFVAEKIGDKKEAEVNQQVTQKLVDQIPVPDDVRNEYVDSGMPKPLCLDVEFERYFAASYNDVVAAINKLNARINNDLEGFVSLNDFYYEIKAKPSKIGNKIGWNREIGMLKIPDMDEISYAGTSEGWPCWKLEWINPPDYEFNYFRSESRRRPTR